MLFRAPKDGVTGLVGLEGGRVGRSTPQKCNMTPWNSACSPSDSPMIGSIDGNWRSPIVITFVTPP